MPEMAATVIRHDLHAVACSCGPVRRAAAPAGAGAPGTVTSQWPAGLVRVPDGRARHPGAPVRKWSGADRGRTRIVHGLLARAAAAVKRANQLIRALIIAASVMATVRSRSVRARPTT